jgi:hypothetical protein
LDCETFLRAQGNCPSNKPTPANPGDDAWEVHMPLQKVYGRRFENESVALDGRHYVNCRFASRNKVIVIALKIHDSLLKAAGVKTIVMNLGPEATFDAPKLD